MNYASFGSRFLALIIDVIIITALSSILPFTALYYDILPASYENSFLEVLSNFEALIISPLYFVGFRYWNNGQTLGKKVLRIKTINIKGKKLSLYQSAVDCLGYYFLPIDFILGAIFSARDQRLTQMCSDTVVVEEYS